VGEACRKIVQHGHLVARGQIGFHDMGADKAGAAGDQNFGWQIFEKYIIAKTD
jgi:hypothetical protein